MNIKRSFTIRDEREMQSFAQQFASCCPSGILVGLTGTLAAGKSFFVREVAVQYGADRTAVLSPTFTICNEYETTPKIFHLDLYRIGDEDEFYDLGVDEMCQEDAVVFVEWADRFASALPDNRIDLHLEVTGPTARQIEVAISPSADPAIRRGLVDILDVLAAAKPPAAGHDVESQN